MIKLSRPHAKQVSISLSPLIDVVFILLVFVVLVARFIDHERLDVDLPDSAAGTVASGDALFVYVLKDERVLIRDREVPSDALRPLLAQLRPRHERIVLAADRGVVFDAVVRVMSAAQLAGFDDVDIATDPDADPGPNPGPNPGPDAERGPDRSR